ncbi:MAG: sulfur reduction protein DsrE [Methanobacteriota archaeon]|nr:MAG: sulfur reduction protein DsrE [Euryarchaeota archaeon]
MPNDRARAGRGGASRVFCVNLTHAKDDPDRATVAFVLANAAVGSGKETLVFLSIEGVRLAQKGYADDVREEGFAPLRELMESFAKAGGTIFVCSPCFKKRRLDENNLVAGAAIVGGAKLVEFLADGSPCVSY